jgi:hypothetical protein
MKIFHIFEKESELVVGERMNAIGKQKITKPLNQEKIRFSRR